MAFAPTIPQAAAVASSSSSSRPRLPPPVVKRHRAYFTARELAQLSERQRGKLTVKIAEKARQTACLFCEQVGERLGFPRRTIATAQTLYHRFHLFFALKDFVYHDVILSALYVSSKLHDTLKKPREIVLASYAVRFPDLMNKAKAKGGAGIGVVGEADVDPATLEHDRAKLLSIERLILETICFNFKVQNPFSYVIKLGKSLGASKGVTLLAWRISIDSHRTLAPLEYPPHFIALASIYLAALLGSRAPQELDIYGGGPSAGAPASDRAGCLALVEVLGSEGPWEDRFKAKVGDLEEIIHRILDLFTSLADPSFSAQLLSTTSPSDADLTSTMTSPSSHGGSGPGHLSASSSSVLGNAAAAPSTLATPQTLSGAELVQLKISLREQAALRGPGPEGRASMRAEEEDEEDEEYHGDPLLLSGGGTAAPSAGVGGMAGSGRKPSTGRDVWGQEGVGKNDGSTRFLF